MCSQPCPPTPALFIAPGEAPCPRDTSAPLPLQPLAAAVLLPVPMHLLPLGAPCEWGPSGIRPPVTGFLHSAECPPGAPLLERVSAFPSFSDPSTVPLAMAPGHAECEGAQPASVGPAVGPLSGTLSWPRPDSEKWAAVSFSGLTLAHPHNLSSRPSAGSPPRPPAPASRPSSRSQEDSDLLPQDSG